MAIEQTFFIIKPDALKYSITGYILTLMSRAHLIYAGAKVVRVTDLLAKEHYAEHEGKDFFDNLLKYIKGELHYVGTPRQEFPFTEEYRRVVAIVYHGHDAVEQVRNLVGPTSPITARLESPGTIRAMGAIYKPDGDAENTLFENLVHSSATREDARSEIELWFQPWEISKPMRLFPTVESEDYFFLSENLEIFTEPTPGTKCIVSPGDPVWEGDYEALKSGTGNRPDQRAIRRAAAKYII